jgi:hypothetical protein
VGLEVGPRGSWLSRGAHPSSGCRYGRSSHPSRCQYADDGSTRLHTRGSVPSGAPSEMTRSAGRPWKCAEIFSTVASEVMSPWMQSTPSSGAMGCRSTDTIFGRSSLCGGVHRPRQREMMGLVSSFWVD